MSEAVKDELAALTTIEDLDWLVVKLQIGRLEVDR